MTTIKTIMENDAFSMSKICQPCRVPNLGWNKDLTRTEKINKKAMPSIMTTIKSWFTCRDNPGYTSVNQCLKYKIKTTKELLKSAISNSGVNRGPL
jgi:hypothetical protein